MDNYLYALQCARETWAGWMTPGFFVISEFAYYAILVIIIMLYMCVDKKKYLSMMFTYSIGNCIAQLVKIFACVYRPWISDSRLHVADIAAKSSSGYSFPSGHTVSGATFYGSLAYNDYKSKKRIGFSVIMIILSLLTAFSRNWLGAHSLKDVVVAVIIGFLTVAIGEMLVNYIDKNPTKDKWFLVITAIVIIVAIIYSVTKSYPMDYAADGTLLCDPVKMRGDTIQSLGFLLGVVICWYIDRHVTDFSTDISVKRRIVRGTILAVVFLLLYMVIFKKLAMIINHDLGSFIRSFVSVMICMGLYPYLFTKWEKNHPEE